MNQEKIRILGIAPYEGLKSVMQKMAADRNDIDLTVYVGDLQKGAELAQKNFHGNFDVIISRGGTAEMIGSLTDLPVIEITLSVYDVLRAIKTVSYTHLRKISYCSRCVQCDFTGAGYEI